MSIAKKFLESLSTLPKPYKRMFEGFSKEVASDLIKPELIGILSSSAGNAIMSDNVPLFVYRGENVKKFIDKAGKLSKDVLEIGGTKLASFGANSQAVIAVYDKGGDSFIASTSKDALQDALKDASKTVEAFKKKVKDKVKKKTDKKEESQMSKQGGLNDVNALKKELGALGLKEGSDFTVSIFGNEVELTFTKYAEGEEPQEVKDLIARFEFAGDNSKVDMIDTDKGTIDRDAVNVDNEEGE